MNGNDTVSTDVLIIGGGPSGLATAIRLADILKQTGQKNKILMIEKGREIGSHILSGAVIKPLVFKELLPDICKPGLTIQHSYPCYSCMAHGKAGQWNFSRPAILLYLWLLQN